MYRYKILCHKDRVAKISKGSFPIPSYATLHLSYACNQNCRGCAFKAWNNGYIPSKETAFQIVDYLLAFGIKAFEFGGGGEPTLMPYLEELLKYIRGSGAEYGLITNGVNLRESLLDYVAETATYVRVSLETGHREKYAKYKRVSPTHFDIVVENIKTLMSRKHPDTEVSLKFDIGQGIDCPEDINESVNLAMDLGVTTAQWKSLRQENESTRESRHTCSYWIDWHIKDLSEEYGNEPPTRIINGIMSKETPPPKCVLSPLQTVVDGYGDVYICCYYDRRKSSHCIGNILMSEGMYCIWGSDRHREVIRNIDTAKCAEFDCRYFRYHRIVNEAFKRGRFEIL